MLLNLANDKYTICLTVEEAGMLADDYANFLDSCQAYHPVILEMVRQLNMIHNAHYGTDVCPAIQEQLECMPMEEPAR